MPPPRVCASCATPVADGALYCPSCGAATPTEISLETGTAPRPAAESLDETEQRQRVQRALGAGFELGRLLGRGGFAEVYAATDLKLQRTVAVKVLRPDLVVNRSLTERFLREARAAAKLRHPNIIPMYQVGEAEGLAYFLMPLIEGENLREYMERVGQLPMEESRRILREVAEALAVAHEAGLVHRDIKPDNIMLEGKERRAIVTDFGIAKALGSGESGLTGTGMIIGTPQYMSPEQATGEKEIDVRSDIYSLGVVAYQMLTGRLPFEGATTQELLVKQLTARPVPIGTFRPNLPPQLVSAVDCALSKKPEERFGSARAFASAVVNAKGTPHAKGQESAAAWKKPTSSLPAALCRDCGHEISATDVACPRCGRPLGEASAARTPKRNWKRVETISGLLVVLGFIIALGGVSLVGGGTMVVGTIGYFVARIAQGAFID